MCKFHFQGSHQQVLLIQKYIVSLNDELAFSLNDELAFAFKENLNVMCFKLTYFEIAPDKKVSAHGQKWQKQPDTFRYNLSGKSIVVRIFKGEMLPKTLSIYVLQIFCKIIVNI